MDVVILIIYAVILILSIVLCAKVWMMTENVSEILSILRHSMAPKPPQFSGEYRESKSSLTKGDLIVIDGYGQCKYEGEMNGKHYFYPTRTENLKPSPFLTEGAEPYLEIPASHLSKVLGK